MKENSEFNGLLVSYLLNELNEEEKVRLTNLLESDEELHNDFKQLLETDRILSIKKNLDDIDLSEEWKRQEGEWAAIHNGPDFRSADDEGLALQEEDGRKNTYRLLKRLAIAASVIFLVGISWLLFHFNRPPVPDEQPVAETIKKEEKIFLYREENNTGKIKSIIMEDGSEVMLYDRSVVSYVKPFGQGNRRDVFLDGKGFFKVAKDESRPFTVYSASILTRAIGTQFLVTNYASEETIRVQLVEGKVVIESADSARFKLKKPVFLLPGQELVYNKRTGEIKQSRVRQQQRGARSDDSMANDNPSIPFSSDGSWYMFNNQSLPDVFEELESMFGTKIDYNPADLQKLYFIGKFDKKDSLEYILKYITSINNLKFQKENKRYIITQ